MPKVLQKQQVCFCLFSLIGVTMTFLFFTGDFSGSLWYFIYVYYWSINVIYDTDGIVFVGIDSNIINCISMKSEVKNLYGINFIGCTMEVGNVVEYKALQTNKTMINLYQSNAENLGVSFNYQGSKQGGSTDMGNVSAIIPSIHPKFKIESISNPHTSGFNDAAIKEVNQQPTICVAKSLAMTAIDIILDKSLLGSIKEEFQNCYSKNIKLNH